jgi:TRAP-type uncharacterized transport system fused permease subunit
MVGSIVGVLGIVMGACSLTGLPNYFNQFVVFLSGGYLFLLICLVIIAGLFIGMGLPTTPSYVILVILAVPALIKMGVAPLTAHLVAFWVAVQSNVTPPVALAAIAAAAIAKSDPWKTGWAACKLASWVYLMPFLFIYTPILDVGWNSGFLLTTVKACVALVAWGAALEGYLFKETAWYERVGLLAAALGLLHEGIATDVAGTAIFVAVILAQKTALGRSKHVGATQAACMSGEEGSP